MAKAKISKTPTKAVKTVKAVKAKAKAGKVKTK